MYLTNEQFDLTVEKSFERGMEFQKKNQSDLELKWFELGYNSALREYDIFSKKPQNKNCEE